MAPATDFSQTMYDSDLSNEEWRLIEHPFRPKDNRGATPIHSKRDIVNAILYINKTGAQWRMLPKEYPPWKTVYDHYSNWNRRRVWEAALDELNALRRENNGRTPTPSYAIIDSQSVKTVSSSEERGFDGGKKIKGRKRHIVVDTLGQLITVLVHAANIHDTVAGCDVLRRARAKFPSIAAFSGDAGYRGTAVKFAEDTLGVKLHISKKIKDVFAVLPMRWIVERTFAWLGNYRRLSKDYEILRLNAENAVRIAMLRITVAKCV
jgi:putative transposase